MEATNLRVCKFFVFGRTFIRGHSWLHDLDVIISDDIQYRMDFV